MEEPKKVCIKCKENKLLTEFNKAKSVKDGHRNICRLYHKHHIRLHKGLISLDNKIRGDKH